MKESLYDRASFLPACRASTRRFLCRRRSAGGALRSHRLLSGALSCCRTSLTRASPGMFRQRLGRRRRRSFPLERSQCSSRTSGRRLMVGRLRNLFFTGWRRQIHPRPARLGEPDGDRLLGRSCTVLAFANMFHLLAHVLPSFPAGSFLPGSPLPSPFVGHCPRGLHRQ